MSLEHEGLAFNLRDTPGHQDFSDPAYPVRASADEPFGCHNRMVLLRISALTIGRAIRFGESWRHLIST
jgi:hypothetical protein